MRAQAQAGDDLGRWSLLPLDECGASENAGRGPKRRPILLQTIVCSNVECEVITTVYIRRDAQVRIIREFSLS